MTRVHCFRDVTLPLVTLPCRPRISETHELDSPCNYISGNESNSPEVKGFKTAGKETTGAAGKGLGLIAMISN